MLDAYKEAFLHDMLRDPRAFGRLWVNTTHMGMPVRMLATNGVFFCFVFCAVWRCPSKLITGPIVERIRHALNALTGNFKAI